MARAISADALDVIGAGATYPVTATVTAPGDDPVDFEVAEGWSVAEKATNAGTRLSVSSLTLLPNDAIDDLFEFAGRPGAVYDLFIGIDKGYEVEQIQVFHGYAVEGSARRTRAGVTVALTDPWLWADGVPFTTPLATGIVTRASQIEDIFTEVIDGLTVVTTADGSTICQSGVYTDTRGQAVQQLADDGLLSVGFNAAGDLIIKSRRDLDAVLTPDWHFRTDTNLFEQTVVPSPGVADVYPDVYPAIYGSVTIGVTRQERDAVIVAGTLERTRPWGETLVNRVKVVPGGDWQKWTAQTARLDDESDPRYEDKVGVREIVITSNTIGNAYDAWRLAKATLTRILRVTAEKVKVSVVLNPAIEQDDVAFISALPVIDDVGWNNAYILTSVTHARDEGMSHLEGVSASAYSMSA